MGRSPAKEKEKKKGTSLFLPFPVARTHRISSNDPLNHASPPRERGSNLLSSLYLVYLPLGNPEETPFKYGPRPTPSLH
jgi:hypothetical protein